MNFANTSPNSNRRTHRHFLTKSEKKKIMYMHDTEHLKNKEIAEILCIRVRQVTDFLRQINKGHLNIFSEEEDKQLVDLYNSGVVKESIIAKTIVTKSPWMIRNRIKYLKKTKRICDQNEEETLINNINLFKSDEETIFDLDNFDNFFELF